MRCSNHRPAVTTTTLVSLVALCAASAQAQPQATAPAPQTPLRLWYDAPAADSDDGWVSQSLPLGNGYMGVNVFGGVARERVQITENSLVDAPLDKIGGLNNFAELCLDFPNATVNNYTRDLRLDDATAHVRYAANGVTYTREYIASYPDKVLAIRLAASAPGKLDFTLRPTIPFVTPYRKAPGDGRGKSGTVVARGDTVTLAGRMDYYGLHFEGQVKVLPQGGTMTADNDGGAGTIAVRGATSAVILVAVGTDYPIGDPKVFVSNRADKLKGEPDPHAKVSAILAAAVRRPWEALLARHVADYRALYGRVDFSLDALEPTLPTDRLLAMVRAGTPSPYLEEAAFQFGRYMLISSSRKGALPPNLQGVWNVYQDAPWSAGYWHNVNQQMNYWPAFNTNLTELFDSYVDFYHAYLPAQQQLATQYLRLYHPAGLSPDGDDGWALGNSMRPFEPAEKTSHSGFGTGPWTTMLFWNAWDFTRDRSLLRDTVYPALRGQANFLSRFLTDVDGKLLAKPSSSPENAGSMQSVGTTFDQQMITENFRETIAGAAVLGLKDPLLPTLGADLPRLDPIQIGDSGQIKEYREETSYGSIGDPGHRHISQLLGLYPGELVTAATPAWLDAAKVSLDGRGPVGGTGWSQAERLATWARAGDPAKAYGFYRYWLSHHAMANLWNNHRDSLTTKLFQADANFGVTAGVGEMLLQSQGGIVAPLAALPREWPNGHYRGLLARGAFEVSAEWSGGHADRIAILSRAGGPLRLRYPGIATAMLTVNGRQVEASPAGADEVIIATTAGRTYVATAIPRVAPVVPVTGLAIGADSGNAVRLQWQSVAGAASYVVERALGDAPGYERITTGLTALGHVDDSPAVTAEPHIRYRIVALAPDGRTIASGAVFRLRPVAREVHAIGIDGDVVGYDGDHGSLSGITAAGGRYTVSLNWANGALDTIELTAAADGEVTLRTPLFDRPVAVLAGLRRVAVQPANGMLRLPVRAGTIYRIVSQARLGAAVPPAADVASTPVPLTVTVAADRRPLGPATATLDLPAGWQSTPAIAPLPSIRPGTTARTRFTVTAPPAVTDGSYKLWVRVAGSGWRAGTSLTMAVHQPDLAIGKAARQSSVSVGGLAGMAVDGRTDGQIEAQSVATTAKEDQPWWEVDLGSVQPVGTVALWNRTDACCRETLNDYYLLVSEHPIAATTLSAALAIPGIWSSHRTAAPAPSVRIPIGRPGRYVRVWSAQHAAELDLAEVQVFAPAAKQ